jgi:hypothetical protein
MYQWESYANFPTNLKNYFSPTFFVLIFIHALIHSHHQIEASEKMPVLYQTLYYKNQELDNSEARIDQLGIEVRDLLYMRPAEESVIKIDLDTDSDVGVVEGGRGAGGGANGAKRPRRVESKAFEGSLLIGGS